MTDLVITHASIASMVGGDLGIIENGCVVTNHGKIVWVGNTKDLSQEHKKSIKTIHAKGKWLTPGLIDCHTHLIFAGNRAIEFAMRQQGATYTEIAKNGGGIMATVRETRQASQEELFALAKQRVEQLIAEGVTTIEIKSGYGLDFDSEIKILHVAKQLEKTLPITFKKTFLGAHAVPFEYKSKANEYIDFLCNSLLPEIKKQNLADFVDGFCERIAFSPRQLEKYFKKAKSLGFRIKLHAEQLSNYGGCQLGMQFSALSVDHLEYANAKDVEVLSKFQTVAVLLPGVRYFLQEKHKPPVELLRKYNVQIAIATDLNPGTSPVNSLLTVMNMGQGLLHLTQEEVLIGVTIHAAKALGLEKQIGSIEVGKQADLVLWDVKDIAELSYGIELPIKKTVIRNGEVIYDTIQARKKALC